MITWTLSNGTEIVAPDYKSPSVDIYRTNGSVKSFQLTNSTAEGFVLSHCKVNQATVIKIEDFDPGKDQTDGTNNTQ